MSRTALKTAFDPQLEAELQQALAVAWTEPQDDAAAAAQDGFNPALSALDAAFPAKPQSARAALARAQRRQAAMDDQKRAFLRMVSHELRTPLNAVIGFSEIISSELYGPLGAPQYKEYAQIVHDSGHRLLRLVNQVLEIARLEGQALDMRIGPESLDTALEQVLDGLQPDLKARGATVEVRAAGRLPEVKADARGLRTLLNNLIQNAANHSPKGGTVSVSAHRVEGDMVEIAIQDQGDGVDPNDIPRLLRPFEQGGSPLTRHAEGAGLGLPIVQLLCDAMGGTLKLSCKPGEGLTAQVRLKAA